MPPWLLVGRPNLSEGDSSEQPFALIHVDGHGGDKEMRGERRDSNPRPPGPQPDRGETARAGFRILERLPSGELSYVSLALGPKLGPVSPHNLRLGRHATTAFRARKAVVAGC